MRLLLLVMLLAGCREGPTFSLPDPFAEDALGRLTYNAFGDHAPVFGINDDTIYYEAKSFPPFTPAEGMLLGVPRASGTASLFLPPVQSGLVSQPRLSAISFSPTGNEVAFFELNYRTDLYDAVDCFVEGDTAFTNAQLESARLRVRKPGTLADVAEVTVQFAGMVFDNNILVEAIAHPYHRLFDGEGVAFYRASWSPDGTRMVLSDGLQLRLWTVGQSTTNSVANTTDGILPAWSPDGNWIAFSRPPRHATLKRGCMYYRFNDPPAAPGKPVPIVLKTIYTDVDRNENDLFIVHPDGTGLKSLGQGDAPAWTSNNELIASRAGNISRISLADGSGSVIVGGNDVYEPAISRNAQWVAYARRVAPGKGGVGANYDIWTGRL